MATLHRYGDEKYIFVKGAPEKVLELCVTCMERDGLRTEEILKISDRFASEGMRVLAMAYKRAPDDLAELRHEDVQHDLTLAGIQAMIDPPREEAVEAVQRLPPGGHPGHHDHGRPPDDGPGHREDGRDRHDGRIA